jgi:hypothetical protein
MNDRKRQFKRNPCQNLAKTQVGGYSSKFKREMNCWKRQFKTNPCQMQQNNKLAIFDIIQANLKEK